MVAKKLCVALKDEMKWETFGMILLKTKNKGPLELIRDECKGNTLQEKCKLLLEKWKMEEDDKAQWEQVIEALRDPMVKLNHLARELQEALMSKQQPRGFGNHYGPYSNKGMYTRTYSLVTYTYMYAHEIGQDSLI